MKKELTFWEKTIVNLWNTAVFCGVGVFALELPEFLSDLLGMNLDTYTVQILLLIGCFVLYLKATDIKEIVQQQKNDEELERRWAVIEKRLKDEEK